MTNFGNSEEFAFISYADEPVSTMFATDVSVRVRRFHGNRVSRESNDILGLSIGVIEPTGDRVQLEFKGTEPGDKIWLAEQQGPDLTFLLILTNLFRDLISLKHYQKSIKKSSQLAIKSTGSYLVTIIIQRRIRLARPLISRVAATTQMSI